MLTIRCTRVLRTRLCLSGELPEPPSSTGALGDWHLHLVRLGSKQFALATSERSLLTVLLPARELRTRLLPNLRASVSTLLETLSLPHATIQCEIAAMEPVAFGRATNRRVLGSMNDLAFQAGVHLAHDGHDLLALSRRLARTPMSAIGPRPGTLGFPDQIACALLGVDAA
jgi:hypothetical protein